MGCGSSTPVVESKVTKNIQDPNNNCNQKLQNDHTKDNSSNDNIINGVNSPEASDNTSQKLEIETDRKRNPSINVEDMSVETQMSPTNETTDENVNSNSNTVVANDTNNNKNNSDVPSNEEDSFDAAAGPLSRDAMLNKKHKETEETLNFVYKHSSSIPYAAPADSTLPNLQTVGNRHANRRRPSGVPPPPRALLSSDPMAKYGKKPLAFAEEEEEED